VQWLSSVYYQLIQDTDEGLYLVQWLSSEIKLRYEAALGETIYPTKHSQMLGMVEHHQRDPKPNNRLWLEPTQIGHKYWMNDIIVWWGSVVGIGQSHDFSRSHDFGWYVRRQWMDRWTPQGLRGCCRTVAGRPLDVCGYGSAGLEGGKPINLRLGDRTAI